MYGRFYIDIRAANRSQSVRTNGLIEWIHALSWVNGATIHKHEVYAVPNNPNALDPLKELGACPWHAADDGELTINAMHLDETPDPYTEDLPITSFVIWLEYIITKMLSFNDGYRLEGSAVLFRYDKDTGETDIRKITIEENVVKILRVNWTPEVGAPPNCAKK